MSTRSIQAAENLSVPIRIAIAAPINTDAPPAWKQTASDWASLVAADLSKSTDYTVVERSQLDLLSDETARGLSQRENRDAVRAVKALAADWMLVGTLWRGPATNLWILRLVDARTGILSDTGIVPVDDQSSVAAATAAASFVRRAAKASAPQGGANFFGVGAFEDVGLSRRYPDFSQTVRLAVERRFSGTKVVAVERQHGATLLKELQLRLGGFLDAPTTNGIVPSLVLVDGLYQAVQDREALVEVVVRVERVGGKATTRSFRGKPGPDLESRIADMVAEGTAEITASGAAVDRTQEAQAQLSRGNELARFPRAMNVPEMMLGGDTDTVTQEVRRQNIALAVEAFSSALALAPELSEAKLGLAVCLLSGDRPKVDEGRNLLREVVAGTTNRGLAFAAYARLAASLKAEQPVVARNLFRMLAAESPDHLFTYVDMTERLVRSGVLPESEAAIAEDALVDSALRNVPKGGGIDAFMLGGNTLNLLIHSRGSVQPETERFLAGFVARQSKRIPRFAPYYVAALVEHYEQTSPWLLQQLEDLIHRCESEPDHMESPASFYQGGLPVVLSWCAVHQEDAFACRVGDLLSARSRSISPESRLMLAFSLRATGRTADAVMLLRSLEGQQIAPQRAGRWGESGTPVDISVLVTKWTGAGAQATPAAPVEFSLGPPRLSLGKDFAFVAGLDQVWIGDGLVPLVLDSRANEIRLLPKAPALRKPIRCAAVGGGSVWFGTEGDGLIENRPEDGTWRHLHVADGLLMDEVSALLFTPARLWIGFGAKRTGGIGYIDLNTRQLVMMTSRLSADLSQGRARSANEKTEAPHGRVTGLTARSGTVLAIAPDVGIHRLLPGKNEWFLVADSSRMWHASSIGVTEHFILAAGQFPPFKAGLAPDFSKEVALDPLDLSLPTQWGHCVVGEDNDRAWLGGAGYLARINLVARRTEALCVIDREPDGFKVDNDHRVRALQIDGGRLWVAVGRHLHSLPLPLKVPSAERPR